MKRLRVAVIGESTATEKNYTYAEQVGKLLAENNFDIVCGGRSGVMEAVCKGAHSAGGTTIGILPSLNLQEGNDYIDIPIVTGIGYARNMMVVHNAHGIIAVGGWYGTLSEIGYALDAEIPTVALNSWFFEQKDHPPEKKKIMSAATPVEAVHKIIEAIKNNG